MLIYKDIFTGDEVLSDTHKIELIDGVVLKVKAKKETFNYDVDESAIGGNKSQEGGDDEQAESSSKLEYNLVECHKLQPIYHVSEKKDYQKHIKTYMKKIIENLEKSMSNDDQKKELDSIKKNLGGFVKKEVMDKFKESDFEFYVGEHGVEDEDKGPLVILVRWEDGGDVPYFYYFKHGLEEEKV